ncbi:hypothetical protein NDU88_005584 [Pleurodeles waltl]|uniref:Uncharacterized protein n=1 Tax=Pleurodeles waltl TaxID=8319 RepID=A0AAV7MYD0_PLEWA|nr:hypothetical protein NDU88_005584 [Pleurodeles waltl]
MLPRPWASAYAVELTDNLQSRHVTPDDQLTTMTSFYSQLYSATIVPDTIALDANTIKLLWLDPAHLLYLDAPFTIEEIIQVIQRLHCNKAMGLHERTTSYKKCADLLGPRLPEVYEDSLASGVLLSSLREVVIIDLNLTSPLTLCD